MKTFRCSALPRIMLCPASQVLPEITIESDNEASRIGSAVHEALASYLRDETFNLNDIARKHRVELGQIESLFWIGKGIFEEHIRDSIKVIRIEQQLKWPAGGVTGTADIVGDTLHEDIPTVSVIDWKSGDAKADHRDQLIGYAKLALNAYGNFDQAKIITVWLRDQFYEIEDITPDDIADWERHLRDARDHPERYVPGKACTWCPREHECVARKQLVQTAATDLLSGVETDIAPAKLGELHPKAKLLTKMLKRLDEITKHTIATSGPIPLGDGRQLCLVETPKEKIDFAEAMPVIVEELGSIEVVIPALSIGKGRLVEIARDRVPHGQKGKTVKALLRRLRDTGALTNHPYMKLAVSKVPAKAIKKGE